MILFGKELILIRKGSGISQIDLAKKLSFSRSYICKLENGERQPNHDVIIRITEEFKLDIYTKNKLLIFAELEPEFDSSSESHKVCLKLAIYFKENGLLKQAQLILQKGIKTFDNTVEIYVLMANLHLLKGEYNQSIRINKEAINLFSDSILGYTKLGITKAELIHNLGNVFFERSLKTKKVLELLIIENNNPDKINELKNECINDFAKAIENFEQAVKLEPDNVYITEQLAKVYLNMGSLESEKQRTKFLKKAIEMYEKVLSFPLKNFKTAKRLEVSVFLAMSYAKIYEIKEAAKIINIVINCLPEYSIAYYAKACIFSINGKDKVEFLQVAYDNLKSAIELSNDLKNGLELEIDLLNLRLHPLFETRFFNLNKKDISS